MTELFAPLRSRAFRWLEGTALFASTGVWMITLVGGYIMERLTTSPVLVTLAAAMGPLAGICAVVFSGAAADSRDRRGVLLLAKILLIGSVAFLVVMSSSQLLTPATLRHRACRHGDRQRNLLAVVVDDGRQPRSPDLVPIALSLDSFQWNIGQVIGPVLGGAVLRGAGTTVFFALCAAVMVPHVCFFVLVAGPGRPALVFPSGVGCREPPRRRFFRLALLHKHAGAESDSRPHGSVCHPGGRPSEPCSPFSPPDTSTLQPSATACSWP